MPRRWLTLRSSSPSDRFGRNSPVLINDDERRRRAIAWVSRDSGVRSTNHGLKSSARTSTRCFSARHSEDGARSEQAKIRSRVNKTNALNQREIRQRQTRNGALFRDVAVTPKRHAAASRHDTRKVPSDTMLLNAWATGAFRARGLHVTFIELSRWRSSSTRAVRRF